MRDLSDPYEADRRQQTDVCQQKASTMLPNIEGSVPDSTQNDEPRGPLDYRPHSEAVHDPSCAKICSLLEQQRRLRAGKPVCVKVDACSCCSSG